MKLKDGVKNSTSDFYYDLFLGGYIVPAEVLDDPADVKRVEEAMEVIEEFASLFDEDE